MALRCYNGPQTCIVRDIMDIPAFIRKWHLASGGERNVKNYFLLDLCTTLGVAQRDVGQDR